MYVAEGLDQLILSKEACESLGLIESNFPTIGSHGSAEINTHTLSGRVEGVEAQVTYASNLLPFKPVKYYCDLIYQPVICHQLTVRLTLTDGDLLLKVSQDKKFLRLPELSSVVFASHPPSQRMSH